MITIECGNVKHSIGADRYPDNTLAVPKEITKDLIDESKKNAPYLLIRWNYENDSELFTVKALGDWARPLFMCMVLRVPYLPNARMDRVKTKFDVFTLKSFADIVNSVGFDSVITLDVHSFNSQLLINNLKNLEPTHYIEETIKKVGENVILFYPDEGAMKRYSELIKHPYMFGVKRRDWETGRILGLDIVGEAELIKGKDFLIVDDICSRGGTPYFSAKKLKECGANDIYVYVTHCEDTIFSGEVFSSGLIKKVFTTNSIQSHENEMLEIITGGEK